MTRAEIYAELEPLAEYIRYDDVGAVRRRETWEAIDHFLDMLVEIQKVEENAAVQ